MIENYGNKDKREPERVETEGERESQKITFRVSEEEDHGKFACWLLIIIIGSKCFPFWQICVKIFKLKVMGVFYLTAHISPQCYNFIFFVLTFQILQNENI